MILQQVLCISKATASRHKASQLFHLCSLLMTTELNPYSLWKADNKQCNYKTVLLKSMGTKKALLNDVLCAHG